MKKILLLVLAMTMFIVAPGASATDICSNTPLSTADFNVEVTSAVHLRDISCMDSNVVLTLSGGEVAHVIGKTEGWHKIELADGTQGWLWETFVKTTTKPFNPSTTPEPTPEPDPDPVLYEEPKDPLFDTAGHKYEDAIWYIYDEGIVQGYEDNSYQPYRTINRAELLKIVVEAKYNESDYTGYAAQKCFDDVNGGLWYTPYICFAKAEGIVEGYPDNTFKPEQEINFVEALKIAMIGFGYEYVEGEIWYKDLIDKASDELFIPNDVTAFNQQYTRGQMADTIARVLKSERGENDEYLPGDLSYFSTYESIEAGISIEDQIGTGNCVYGGAVYESDETIELDECTDCTCGQGQWYCTGLCMEEEPVQ